MMFNDITHVGPPVDDQAILDELPRQLANILRQTNWLVACGGAFHLRGACADPVWDSLRGMARPHRLRRRIPKRASN